MNFKLIPFTLKKTKLLYLKVFTDLVFRSTNEQFFKSHNQAEKRKFLSFSVKNISKAQVYNANNNGSACVYVCACVCCWGSKTELPTY